MTRTATTCVAAAAFAVSLLATAAGQVFYDLSAHTPTSPDDLGLSPLDSLFALVFVGVGGLIATRQPRNPVGWCLVGVGLLASMGMSGFAYGYTYYSLGPGGPLPVVAWAAWWSIVSQNIGVPLAAMTFVLLPTGRPASRRWALVMWLTFAFASLNLLLVAVQPQPLPGFRNIDNPAGLPADGPFAVAVAQFGNLSDEFLPFVLIVGAVALVARFRSARGEQRQQLKWVVFALSLVPIYFIGLIALTIAILTNTPPGFDGPSSPMLSWAWTMWRLVIAAVPLSIGFAILRHRLFDIDLIIRRTLVYGLLSLVLATGYLASFVLLQELLQPLTSGSDVAIVASTLVMATLFQPLRARIQHNVERYFYRQPYDAARIAEGFAARLAHEVDVESLSAELLGAVSQNMHPAHMSLWLRTPERPRQ